VVVIEKHEIAKNIKDPFGVAEVYYVTKPRPNWGDV
jgi:hypothetical protein